MAFRKICPSTNGPGHSRTEMAVPDSYTLRDGLDAKDSHSSSVKRRRVPHAVTRNACSNCKKARAKCDGSKPCNRCVSRMETSQCVYEIHLRDAKEELVKYINELKEKDRLTGRILDALSSDETVSEILDQLQSGHAHKNIVEWLDQSLLGDAETPPSRKSSLSTMETSDHEMGGSGPIFDMWTSAIPDPGTIDYLLQLYFEWVHPVHTLFNKDRFLDSYKLHSGHFCSSILVNALCAMACHLHPTTNKNKIDFGKLGVEFSDTVRTEIDTESAAITTIQTLAVMFLVDLSRSNALRAASHLKTASNILTRVEILEIDGFQEVWVETVRGLRNLNIEWAQMTFQVPPTIHIHPTRAIESLNELCNTNTCSSGNDPPPDQATLFAIANREKSKLIEIIGDAVTLMYTQHGPQITALQVLQLYNRFISWHDGLSSTIANVAGEHGQAPHYVLSLLILYSNSVVQLLQPLLDFEGFQIEVIQDTVWKHAQQGQQLLNEHYQSRYTYGFQSPLQMLAALHLIDVIARFFPRARGQSSELGFEVVLFGRRILTESQPRFPVAGPFQEMLRKTAIDCGITFSKRTDASMTIHPQTNNSYREDDLIDACTRNTYVQPVKEIQRIYSPSFSADWATYGASFGFQPTRSDETSSGLSPAEENTSQGVMEIRNVLNMS